MTKRRNLLKAALGAFAIAAMSPPHGPRHARGRIAFLWNGREGDPVLAERVATFKSAMRETGYDEGKDYVVEQRFVDNDLARTFRSRESAGCLQRRPDRRRRHSNGQGGTRRGARDSDFYHRRRSGSERACGDSAAARRQRHRPRRQSSERAVPEERLELLRQIVPHCSASAFLEM